MTSPRFDRQVRFAALGAGGQERLERSSVLIVGCGALGGSLAMTLVRSGIGRVVLVDRDVVELSNLPRQVLFEERHLGHAKVQAAAESLARIGGPTRVEAHALHLDSDNLAELAQGCELVLDGTDNLATRYLINDFAIDRGVPWIYGGVVGASGLVMPVIPGAGACLRCIFPDPAPPGSLPTCDSAGVLLPAVSAIAALQAGAALRWLGSDAHGRATFQAQLIELDVWQLEAHHVPATRDPDCPCCGRREFPFLDASPHGSAISLCGRNTVQIRPARVPGARPDLERIAQSLAPFVSDARLLDGLLVFRVEELAFTVFPDGRALIEGTSELDRARSLYDRILGS
ncbi:MAG: ThiF family adenylyltransferase [Planctomycetes bacterium]|nr:ThiF family adenylyltransferase [Planctomycetota bacterium]